MKCKSWTNCTASKSLTSAILKMPLRNEETSYSLGEYAYLTKELYSGNIQNSYSSTKKENNKQLRKWQNNLKKDFTKEDI